MSLNIHVWGNGGREEAIKDAISKSPLFKSFVGADKADLIIFGPEKPICSGLADVYPNSIGVNKKFSRLESSKLFAKQFMDKYGIKNPKVLAQTPFVLKDDGLCSGKGVKVFNEDFFIEEFLEGEEISVMSLFDGKTLLNFPPARDFKRLSAQKNAPNTGGMGAYCPVELTPEQNEKLAACLQKLEQALISEGADFTGFIYSGLIWSRKDWYVLEYNVRLGDPEAQVMLQYLKTDFLEILVKALEGRLNEVKLEFNDKYCACLTVAAGGYPENPITGDEIILPESENVKVYYANVKEENGKLYSNGGRVLSLCTCADDPFPILKDYADKIQMKNKYFRHDCHIKLFLL